MASLRENRLLCYSLLAAVTMVFLLASGLMPELSQFLEVVEFPSEVTMEIVFLYNCVLVINTCKYALVINIY